MQGAVLHRFTRESYYRMVEGGVLQQDARVELLDGQIIEMFPTGPFHGGTLSWLVESLAALSKGRWQTFCQSGLNLSTYYEPQPDLMLLRPRSDRYREYLPTPADVFLIIEVSDSSLLLDRSEKLTAYAAAMIPEAWIINVPEKVVEVYRAPGSTGYAERRILRNTEEVSPALFSDAVLSVAAIFGLE